MGAADVGAAAAQFSGAVVRDVAGANAVAAKLVVAEFFGFNRWCRRLGGYCARQRLRLVTAVTEAGWGAKNRTCAGGRDLGFGCAGLGVAKSAHGSSTGLGMAVAGAAAVRAGAVHGGGVRGAPPMAHRRAGGLSGPQGGAGTCHPQAQ